MNRPLPLDPALPKPVSVPGSLKLSSELRTWLGRAFEGFQQDLIKALQNDLRAVHEVINSGTQGVGDVLVADTTLILTHPIHHVSGSAVIQNIIPQPGFSGPVWLIADGVWSLTVVAPPDGNIASAKTAVVGTAMMLVFDMELWYPSS